MKHCSVMLKPASGHCNMRCSYCFYADLISRRALPSYGMMSAGTAKQIIDNVFADTDPGGKVTFAFQGGEPTLAGLDFFRDFFSYAEENRSGISVEYALQTNGLILDDSWCDLLGRYPVLVGLSIDGNPELHDFYRKDAQSAGTFKRVMQTKRMLDKHKVPYNMLCVLTNQAARHPQRTWQFLVKENIDFVQFIPCLNELAGDEKSPYALEPERFYHFHSVLFRLWAKLLQNGRYISIKLFDDLVNYYLKGLPTACGIHGQCAVQLVAEGDGSVFPCDFYMLDEFCMGSLTEARPSELIARGASFIGHGRGYENDEPCESCKYRPSCAGGCKRMKDAMYISGGFCWYAKLLDDILPPLLQIGRQLA